MSAGDSIPLYLEESGLCPECGNFLCGAYYRVNGHTACAICAIRARARKCRYLPIPTNAPLTRRLLDLVSTGIHSFYRLDGPHLP